MPNKIHVRGILEAKLRGMSNNDVASACHCSMHSVQDVVRIATESEIRPLGKFLDMPEENLYRVFFHEIEYATDNAIHGPTSCGKPFVARCIGTHA